MTASDGSSRETTGIALVLDPEFVDLSEKQTEYIAKLEAVAPQADVGGWLFRSRKFSADEAQRSLKIYIRPASAQ
jgi:hypothetical protein